MAHTLPNPAGSSTLCVVFLSYLLIGHKVRDSLPKAVSPSSFASFGMILSTYLKDVLSPSNHIPFSTPRYFETENAPAFTLDHNVSYESTINDTALRWTIGQAKQNLWQEYIKDESTWNMPPQLGFMFECFYYFSLEAIGKLEESAFDFDAMTSMIKDYQLEDGSWHQAPIGDPLLFSGHLDTTVVVYLFLKTTCKSCDSHLKKAQDFILKQGGVDAVQTMTKYKLATFGQYPWNQLFSPPVMVLQNRTAFHRLLKSYSVDLPGQWATQHIPAMAYLSYREVVHPVGADISEVFLKKDVYMIMRKKVTQESSTAVEALPCDIDAEGVVQQILSWRRPQGSFGCYTVATELSLIALQDFRRAFRECGSAQHYFSEINDATAKGFQFLENAHFHETGKSTYLGPVMDGRWWDTLIASWALLETGETNASLDPIAKILREEAWQPNGGVGFGRDFEYAPDTDDTSYFVLLQHGLGRGPRHDEMTKKSVDWLESMQNSDGGFPAFDKDKTSSWFLWVVQKVFDVLGISDSTEIFDMSCPDNTGHVIETLAEVNPETYHKDHPVIVKAIEYLKSTQTSFGAWQGRWGINYMYGTGAVIPGLARVGLDVKEEPWIVKAIQWLLDHQNPDGGFGESLKSYDDVKWAGVGVSTASQTSWALMALLEAADAGVSVKLQERHALEKAIDNGIQFLVKSFESNDYDFTDASVVGMGHRGIVSLQYPVYAKSFPLVAMSRYQRKNGLQN